MGFNDNEPTKNDSQMSLFDFKMGQHDFIQDNKASAAVKRDSWTVAHREPEKNKTPRFLTLSATLHAAAILIIGIISVPLVEQAKTETITIEIAEPEMPRMLAKGAPVMATQGGTPVIAEELPAKIEASELGGPGDIVAAAPIIQEEPAKAPKAKAAKAAKIAKVAKAPADAGRSIAPKTTMKAVPMTIDDIDSPELDAGEVASAKVAAPMNEDFNEDFDKISNNRAQHLDSEKSKMDEMAAALAADQEDSLKSIESQNRDESAQLAAEQKELRKRNAKAIASAIASEKASAAAAREQAERDAADRAAAVAAAKAAQGGLGGNGNGYGQGEGRGAGNNGVDQASQQVAGGPTGVRSLDQLRQMPGNPRPNYSEDERLRGDQGKVSFEAYITQEGVPTQFRMRQSTGHRNLDAKTLSALKKWRFYPGQEGWVEMPFQWDLKGGVQEVKGRLRTAGNQR